MSEKRCSDSFWVPHLLIGAGVGLGLVDVGVGFWKFIGLCLFWEFWVGYKIAFFITR